MPHLPVDGIVCGTCTADILVKSGGTLAAIAPALPHLDLYVPSLDEATSSLDPATEARIMSLLAEQDASIPGQIRVFLDSQPKLLAHLREPSTARVVRRALTGTVSVAPEREIIDPGGTFKWFSLMSICMVILGFVTGFREIVKKRPMLDFERWRCGIVIA